MFDCHGSGDVLECVLVFGFIKIYKIIRGFVAKDKSSKESNKDKNFKFASSLIKVIAVVIAIMVMVISRFAFIFFAAAMLPTIFAIFFDRNYHKCLSATICSFNLIGVMPYLVRMWESNSVDHTAKMMLADISTWMVIYGAAFMGQLIYATLPLLFVKALAARVQVRVGKLEKEHKEICKDWGIGSPDSKGTKAQQEN